jgi:hypothetical protein
MELRRLPGWRLGRFNSAALAAPAADAPRPFATAVPNKSLTI